MPASARTSERSTEEHYNLAQALVHEIRTHLSTRTGASRSAHRDLPFERSRVADEVFRRRLERAPLHVDSVYRYPRRLALFYAGLVQEVINGWLEDRAEAVGAVVQGEAGLLRIGPYLSVVSSSAVIPLQAICAATLGLRNATVHSVLHDEWIGVHEPALALVLLNYLLLGAVHVATGRGTLSLRFALTSSRTPSRELDWRMRRIEKLAFSHAVAALNQGASNPQARRRFMDGLQNWARHRGLPDVSTAQCLRILLGRPVELKATTNPRPIPAALTLSNASTSLLQEKVPWVFSMVEYVDAWTAIKNRPKRPKHPLLTDLDAAYCTALVAHLKWLDEKLMHGTHGTTPTPPRQDPT